METSHNEFPYKALQNVFEIRILRLLPGQFEDEIQCILDHALLSETPEYTALSYAWGSPTETSPITLRYEDPEDKQLFAIRQFQVTANLEAALRHIRNPFSEQSLWIDAICIDQRNKQERSLQVQKMGEIYSTASKVLVWLGKLVEKEEAEMGILPDHMRAIWTSLREASSSSSASLNSSDNEQSNTSKAVSITGDDRLTAFGAICNRSWFTRIWVLQEHMLASSAVAVMAGSERMLLDDLLQLAFEAHAAAMESRPTVISYFLLAVRHLFYRRSFRSQRFLNRPLGERILKALVDTTGCLDATDPRDRLYGLLGILGSVSSHSALVPNYMKSLETFHIDLARFIIESTQTLAVLQCIGRANQPSWVPDWDWPSTPIFERLDGIQEFTKASFSNCGRILYTRAILLGKVVLFRLIRGTVASDPTAWYKTMENLEQSLCGIPSVCSRFSDVRQIIAALLDATLPDPIDERSPEKRDNKARYDILMGRSVWPGELVHPRRNEADDLNHLVGVLQGHFGQGLGIIVLSNGMLGRILGDPESNAAYEGDIAFLFPGCRPPLLLTPVGDKYIVHRRCHIGGYLDQSKEAHVKLLQQQVWEDIAII